MPLEISIRDRGGVTIIDIKGRVVLGDGTEELGDIVKELLSKGRSNFILNLAAVDKMDSTGVGAMVGGYVSALRQNAGLKLLNPTKRMMRILTITKLDTVFEIFADEDAAVASFV